MGPSLYRPNVPEPNDFHLNDSSGHTEELADHLKEKPEADDKDKSDIDADAILNVSAQYKTTGKSKQITIVNGKGRLGQSEIDPMMLADENKCTDDEDGHTRNEYGGPFCTRCCTPFKGSRMRLCEGCSKRPYMLGSGKGNL